MPLPPASVRIGVLTLGTLESLHGPSWPYFVRRLGGHGYVEGQKLIFAADYVAQILAGADPAELVLSQRTVARHLDHILAKLGVAARAADWRRVGRCGRHPCPEARAPCVGSPVS